MFGIGRDLCGSSSPTALPKQGHPEQAAQDFVQAGFENLRRRKQKTFLPVFNMVKNPFVCDVILRMRSWGFCQC